MDLKPPASPMLDADSDNSNSNSNSNINTTPPIRPPGGTPSPSLPLTTTASVLLADLPHDATAALAGAASAAGFPPESKVVVKFKPVGSAPLLPQDVCKISAARRFEEVVRYLRRKLRCGDAESVFLYVNQAFAPSLDEIVGNLHQCFKNGQDQLVVAYSITPAFG